VKLWPIIKYFAPRVGNRLTFYLQNGAMDA